MTPRCWRCILPGRLMANTSITASLFHYRRRCATRTSGRLIRRYNTTSFAVRSIWLPTDLEKRNWCMMQPRPTRVLHCLVSVLMDAICSLPWASMAVSIAGTMMPTLSVSRWISIPAPLLPLKPLRPSTLPPSTATVIPTATLLGRATDIG